jgi:hypothetical protein
MADNSELREITQPGGLVSGVNRALGASRTPDITEANTDEKEAVRLVRDLMDEATNARSNIRIDDEINLEQAWNLGLRRWMGDHHDEKPAEGLVSFTLNRDQVAITNNVADQTATPFRTLFVPVETGDQPTYFVKQTSVSAIMPLWEQSQQQQIPEDVLFGVKEQQILGLEPLNEQQADLLSKLAEPVETVESIAQPDGSVLQQPKVENPLLLDDPIVRINDAYRAQAVQKVFDLKWKQGRGDVYMKENELYCNIFGHCPCWVELEPNTWRFTFDNLHVRNALPDPDNTEINDFDYLIVTERIGFAKAKMMYSKFADDLDKAANEGRIEDSGARGTVQFPFNTVDYKRRMILIRTAWIRNHAVPMTPDEAVESGRVEVLNDEEGGQQFLHSDTGATITPDAQLWPTKSVVRVVKMIDQIDRIILDTTNPFSDIPVGWNKNIPIPYTPYGMGESVRLRHLTDAINKLGEVMINHFLYYEYPQEYWPKSLLDQMEQAEGEPHAHPGFQVGIPDQDFFEWFKGPKSGGFFVVPPPIPSHVIELWGEFRNEHNMMSGNTGVRQGIAPSAQASGKLVQELVTQAAGAVAYKSSFTEQMVEYIGKILADSLVRMMPAAEWSRTLSELGPQAFDDMWSSMDTFEYDVSCEIVTGRGATKQLEQQKAIEDRQMGAISLETYQIKREIADPKGEQRKMLQEARSQAMAAAGQSTNANGTTQPGQGPGQVASTAARPRSSANSPSQDTPT